MEKAKDGGLDAVETYVFWDGHEPSPGKVPPSASSSSSLMLHFFSDFAIFGRFCGNVGRGS